MSKKGIKQHMLFNKGMLCVKHFPFAMNGDGEEQGEGADSQEVPR